MWLVIWPVGHLFDKTVKSQNRKQSHWPQNQCTYLFLLNGEIIIWNIRMTKEVLGCKLKKMQQLIMNRQYQSVNKTRNNADYWTIWKHKGWQTLQQACLIFDDQLVTISHLFRKSLQYQYFNIIFRSVRWNGLW